MLRSKQTTKKWMGLVLELWAAIPQDNQEFMKAWPSLTILPKQLQLGALSACANIRTVQGPGRLFLVGDFDSELLSSCQSPSLLTFKAHYTTHLFPQAFPWQTTENRSCFLLTLSRWQKLIVLFLKVY